MFLWFTMLHIPLVYYSLEYFPLVYKTLYSPGLQGSTVYILLVSEVL
jgi:hypothetical protein